ncbi:hypothetical protein D9619_012471 [Psilocybe cf. subviscida]|uniref:DEAD/DEAH box helicase domain-containing protein n=1 Tax=Psilocybe cf. subviscida TaxID=2480587 RepID=A0A8H5ARC3_9AGAR|nr:hypothetical protein D9619_012471 [Psilocybe cf. subviscida]
MHTNTNPSNTSGTSRPWKNYDEPRRSFSDFDRPLKEGAYDAPELKDEFFHPIDAVSPSPTMVCRRGGASPCSRARRAGKSIAYLLPLLQAVKQAEVAARTQTHLVFDSSNSPSPAEAVQPARGLLRSNDVKLRVFRVSRANVASTAARPGQGQGHGHECNGAYETEGQEQNRAQGGHPVDVVVDTPMKLLEMEEIECDERSAREGAEEEGGGEQEAKKYRKVRRGGDRVVHFGRWTSGAPELGLANIKWVVVDEAAVLFDPDFQETMHALHADISATRGVALPLSASALPPSSTPSL